jgi:transposase InsO family protein
VRYPAEFRLRIVRLFLEENYTQRMIADEFGVGKSTIGHWVRRYRNEGEEGLRDRPVPKRKPTAKKSLVREKIVETKLANPRFGIRRIRDTLRRFLLLKTSAETVRKTLHAEGLADPPQAKKPRRSDPKPRFFERSTPNQLWQTDIFTFRLAGKNAYLIGFIDDYSRYLVGLQLYRSQTAEHVLETYRTAVGEYGVPKEMLTDNGRQYTNWRGTTRFEKEMAKDRVKHFRSRPHHPMTLGKIERFWKTIWGEFLSRAQFDTFEEARERVALWCKYYNHRRPHQGIGSLCPADRFFEVQGELRTVIERGVEDNALELALRGKPNPPFYMVGRFDGQSVVMHAEKGKLKLSLDGQEVDGARELEYNMEGSADGPTQQQEDQAADSQATDNSTGTAVGHIAGSDTGDTTLPAPSPAAQPEVQRAPEGPGGADGLDRGAVGDERLPGAVDQLHAAEQMAGRCAAGYVERTGAEAPGGQRWREPQQPAAEASGEGCATAADAAGAEPAQRPSAASAQCGAGQTQRRGLKSAWECALQRRGDVDEHRSGGSRPAAGGSDHARAGRSADGHGSCRAAGGLAQDLPRMGEAGAGQHAGWADGPAAWTSHETETGSGADPAGEGEAGPARRDGVQG